MEKSDLQILLENEDYECIPYSGRYMYGKKCLAIVTYFTLWQLADSIYNGSYDYLEFEFPPEPKQDNMGNQVVYYWPNIPYVENPDHGIETED